MGLEPLAEMPRAYPDEVVPATCMGVDQPAQRRKLPQYFANVAPSDGFLDFPMFKVIFASILHLRHLSLMLQCNSVLFIFYHRIALGTDNLAPDLSFNTFLAVYL